MHAPVFPVLVIAIVICLTGPTLLGQAPTQAAKPALNGIWVLNPLKSEKAIVQGHSPVRGQMTITVTDARATFEWMIPGDDGNPIKPNGDGFTERTTVCAFGNEPAENIRSMSRLYCSAKWEGDQLVTTTHEPTFPLVAKGTRSPGTGTYSVSGAELKVRSVVPRPAGGAPFVSEVFWDRLK